MAAIQHLQRRSRLDSRPIRIRQVATMAATVRLANDPSLTTEEWWSRCEPQWCKDPAYWENVTRTADERGREWVRDHMGSIHRNWEHAARMRHVQDFMTIDPLNV